MPRNGAGNYSLPEPPFVPGTTISSAAVNNDNSDIATALTGSIAANGETTITGQLKGFVNASPCYSFNGDATTGFGSGSSGNVYIAAAGVNILAATSTAITITGNLVVTGTFNSTGGFSGTVTTTGTTDQFTAFEGISTDAGANPGPIFSAYRNSASPAASDFIGAYDFNGQNSTPAKKLYARLLGQITDPTAGSEDSDLFLQNIIAGVITTMMHVKATGVDLTGLVTATTGFQVGANPQAVPGKQPTYQILNSGTGATYTPTAGTAWIRVRMVGGGGSGGGGSGSTASTFNSISANPGAPGTTPGSGQGAAGGAGGASGLGSATIRRPGQAGGQGSSTGSTFSTGGPGGSAPYFGGGGTGSVTAGPATPNSGGGGGGSGRGGGNGGDGGGGSGEYVELILTATTYTYTVGAGGTGGNGANGAAGQIIVEEYYS